MSTTRLSIDERKGAERRADDLLALGVFDAADALLAAAEAANREDGLEFVADWLALKRIHVAIAAGDRCDVYERLAALVPRVGPLEEVPWHSEELPAWEAGIDGWAGGRADRGLFFASLYLMFGQCLAAEGHYGHALVLLERGETHASPPAAVPLGLSRAACLLDQGRVAECLAALDGIDATARAKPGYAVQMLGLRGRCHLARGEYGPALRHLEAAVRRCREGGFVRAEAIALLNEAEVRLLVNQVSHAEESIAEARRLGDPSGRADRLRSVAQARAGPTPYESAPSLTAIWRGSESRLPAMPDSLPPTPPAFDAFARFTDDVLGVQWALAEGDVAAANARLQAMREEYAHVESPLVVLRLHALAGAIAYDTGDRAIAEEYFAEVLPEFEKRGLWPDVWQSLWFLALCAARLGNPAESLEQRAGTIVEKMSQTLPPEERAVFLLNKWVLEERVLARQVSALMQMRAEVETAGWLRRPWRRSRYWKRLYEFLRKVDAGRRALARHAITGEKLASVADTGPSWWRWLLTRPRDRITVSFLVLPEGVFVARAGWLSLDAVRLPATRVQVREMVRDWHLEASKEKPDAKTLDGLGAAATRMLGVEALLTGLPPRVERLMIVPDDALHGLPFAALPFAGAPLVERFALSQETDRTRATASSGKVRTALVLGVGRTPTGDPRHALPGAVGEAQDVAEGWRAAGADVLHLPEEGAGCAKVKASLAGRHVVHFACHGDFKPDSPEASGLYLVPQEGKPERLTLRDLADIDLTGVRHVTLSSCWGADSYVAPGRWIVSLPETLRRQGAGSVLSALWPVLDEVGRKFIQRFQREILAGKPRDAALAEAQRACRRGEFGSDGQNADAWAGYVLHGAAGPLGR